MAPDQNWLTTLGLVTSSLIAVTANSLLLLVFFRRRGLRTVSNRFVINLLVTNLLSSVLLVPLLIVDQESVDPATTETDGDHLLLEKLLNISAEVERRGEIEEILVKIDFDGGGSNSSSTGCFLCYFAQCTTNLICTTSIFSVLLIGIDQYFAVIHPLRYHSHIDRPRSTVLLAGCWLFSVAVAAVGASVSADANFWRFCDDRPPSIATITYTCSYFASVILAPFVTICAIYVRIYAAAHESSERMRKSASVNSNSYAQLPAQVEKEAAAAALPKVRSAPDFLEHQLEATVNRSSSDRVAAGKNMIVSLRSRISNASVFKYREETRAAKISILVIFMVLACYSPYGLAGLLDATDLYASRRLDYLSLVLLVVSNIVSPFLFAYRNRRIQRELFKFLRLLPPKSPPARRKSSVPNKEETTTTRGDELVELDTTEPFLDGVQIPKLVVECKSEHEKKSILKRVCSKNWGGYKKCNFITVPDSCLDARGSFSSASTQISTEE